MKLYNCIKATMVVSLLTITILLSGCDTPQMCPTGIYRDFKLQDKAEYDAEYDCITFWMIAKPYEDRLCLPRDLSIRNISASAGVEVVINPPNWVKGLPLMLISIEHASKIDPNQYVSLEIWQNEIKKQTVKVEFHKPSDVSVTTMLE